MVCVLDRSKGGAAHSRFINSIMVANSRLSILALQSRGGATDNQMQNGARMVSEADITTFAPHLYHFLFNLAFASPFTFPTIHLRWM